MTTIELATEQETLYKKVLIVDDDDIFRGILRSFVESFGYLGVEANSGRSALEFLKKTHFPIVISDIVMPEMDGLELLRIIKKKHSDVDVLIITAFDNNYSPMKIVQAGASDFLAKPFNLDQLGARLHKIEMERILRNKLYFRAITDELTDLYNRRYFYQKLKREIDRARRQGRPLSIIMLDVDNFKRFNDQYGHLEGDVLLRTIARVLQFSVRQHVDCVFRYGGDEFVVVLPEADEETARAIGCRMQNKFRETAPAGAGLSLGVAAFRDDLEVETLIQLADQRMYEEKSKSKGSGRSQPGRGMRKESHTIRCLNCGNPVHWSSTTCDKCLADPLQKTDSRKAQKIASTYLREASSSYEDRRGSPRIRIRETITHDNIQAVLHNISWGGIQIKTEASLSIGRRLNVALPLEGEDAKLGGVVVYVQPIPDGGSLAGIKFSKTSKEDSRLLNLFLDHHSLKP
ncbi:MAG: diguanylate cyclase [Proteobacteria bacterium]|nr:diguanylate cyclase [Pseudomonadota bacterium]NIS70304.1 diguanylate cyclase [Pseudomonadota bacterium]